MSYVAGEDMIVEEEIEQLYVETLTDDGRDVRDAIKDEHGMNTTQANVALARRDEDYLEHVIVSEHCFDYVPVDSPVSPESDPNVVQTVEAQETVERQKRGLVCDDCVKDTDEVIW